MFDVSEVRKALVIGFDGADWRVMDPLLERGEMPHLARLLQEGVRAPLRSTVPPVTFAAWPSMITGINPGRHGLYSHSRLENNVYYEQKASSGRPIVGQTLFDYLSALGLRVCAYQVPMTYPVWPINGAMIAGYPTPDMTKVFSHPPELAEWVPPAMTTDFIHVTDHETLIAEAKGYVDRVTSTLERFISEDDYHFYMTVEHLNDLFCHRFWRLRDPTFPTYDRELAERLGDPIAESFRLVDGLLGRALARIPNDWVVAVTSDHGHGRGPTQLFYANAWLHSQGLLHLVQSKRLLGRGLSVLRRVARGTGLTRRLAPLQPRLAQKLRSGLPPQVIDWHRTKAFVLHLEALTGGIEINLKGRQPQGIVEPGSEYHQLREQIIAGLQELRAPDTRQAIIEQVWRREELYEGPWVENAPDVVFRVARDYLVGIGFYPMLAPAEEHLRHTSGAHTRHGILALRAPGMIRQGASLPPADILDVMPTLCYAMGLPVPGELDGVVLSEAFESDYLASHAVQTGAPMARPAVPHELQYSEEEEAGIRRSLRGFGYVE